MTKKQALTILVEAARGTDGAWEYWEVEQGLAVQHFTGVVDPDDKMSLLWAYRAASKRLNPKNSVDRKKWLRLIDAYDELLVSA